MEMDTAKSVSSLQAPQVSSAELQSFYETHFSETAVAKFNSNFCKPSDVAQTLHLSCANQDGHDGHDGYEGEDEDDGLGYYSDGVKRTLTDEQIAMFRHSELHALNLEREKKASGQASGHRRAPLAEDNKSSSDLKSGDSPGDSHNSHCEDNTETAEKRKRWKKSRYGRGGPKPDLRKRTWDVVDKGLDYLDYDDG